MHGRSGRITQRCHNSPDGKRGYTARGGFGEILKKSVSRRRLAFACSQRPLWRVPHVLGRGQMKKQNRKNVSLSPYVEKPLNSKVIKSFVPKLRCCKCFSCFEIPMFYVYIYEHPMYILHIHVYGYGTWRSPVIYFMVLIYINAFNRMEINLLS